MNMSMIKEINKMCPQDGVIYVLMRADRRFLTGGSQLSYIKVTDENDDEMKYTLLQ